MLNLIKILKKIKKISIMVSLILVICDEHNLIKQALAQILSDHLELVDIPLKRLVERVMQILLALLILLDQISEITVLHRARRTRTIITVVLEAVSVERVLTQTVDGRKVKLVPTVLAPIGLENDRLRLQVVDLVLKLHDAFQVAINSILILFNFLFFTSHSFQ